MSSCFIQGPRWERLSTKEGLFRGVVRQGYYGKNEISKLYGNAWIGVDTFDQEQSGDYGITMRAPELLSCGCHLVTQRSKEWNYISHGDKKWITFYENEEEFVSGVLKALESVKGLGKGIQEIKMANDYYGYKELVDFLIE